VEFYGEGDVGDDEPDLSGQVAISVMGVCGGHDEQPPTGGALGGSASPPATKSPVSALAGAGSDVIPVYRDWHQL